MPRTPRLVLPDTAHHVVARGVNRQPIFTSGSEKKRYLKRFALVATEEKVLVHGYCLMDNHVHWLLTPTTPDGLARLFRRVHTWWALWFNKKHDRTGHLFQNRYHSSPLGESHYWNALRYIELNPQRAGLVKRPEDWKWSSAKAHRTGDPNGFISLTALTGRRVLTRENWLAFLTDNGGAPDIAFELRQALPASRPCGDAQWICQLEAQYHRKLAWSSPGRPSNKQRSYYAA